MTDRKSKGCSHVATISETKSKRSLNVLRRTGHLIIRALRMILWQLLNFVMWVLSGIMLWLLNELLNVILK